MKLQLDTTAKTIKVEGNVKISELIDALKKLLPKEWDSFTLETSTTIVDWVYPIRYQQWPAPIHYPWYCGTNTFSTSSSPLLGGQYNVEI